MLVEARMQKKKKKKTREILNIFKEGQNLKTFQNQIRRSGNTVFTSKNINATASGTRCDKIIRN